jgi:hypothetical protein
MFDDSPHVQHFKHHKGEYIAAVRAMLAGPEPVLALPVTPTVTVSLTVGGLSKSGKSLVATPTAAETAAKLGSLVKALSLEATCALAMMTAEANPMSRNASTLNQTASLGADARCGSGYWSAGELVEMEALMRCACMV